MKNLWWGIGWRRCVAVTAVLSIVLVWSLASSENSGIESGERDATLAWQDYAEVFSAGDSNSGIVYINWQEPQSTNDFPRATWFLGAYRFDDGSMVVELERGGVLTNNLRYALDYAAAGTDSVLSIHLLNTNGVVLAESDNLLTSSNVDHYVIPAPMDIRVNSSGIQSNATVLLVNVPTAEYPEAAVIQIVGRHILVHEALLYIDEDADGWTSTEEIRNGTSDSIFDGGGAVSNYNDWFNGGGSSTNNPGGGGGDGSGDGDQGGGNNRGILYVDQVIGDDNFTGYAPTVAGRNGPKKTIHRGLAAVEQDGAHTLVIKSGAYGEDLDLRGIGGVKVVIAGRVKL